MHSHDPLLRTTDNNWSSIVASFRRGSYESCVSRLGIANSPKAATLKARALIRLNRDADALTVLANIDNQSNDAESQGECASLASFALLRLGRVAEAQSMQVVANEHLLKVTAWAIRSELRYHEASLNYALGNFEKAYDISVTTQRNILLYYERASHDVVSVSQSVAALKNVAAVADISLGRYSRAFDSLIGGLAICRLNPMFDVGGFSRMLSNVTGMMNECGDGQATTLKLVLDATADITWTNELARLRFFVLRETAYSYTLFGNFSAAFAALRAAADSSITELDRLLLHVDRIFILRELGQVDVAERKLIELNAGTSRSRIAHCDEIDSDALMMLGEHFAAVNVKRAHSLRQLYLNLKAKRIRLTTAFNDERFYGHQLRLESALAIAEGEHNVAFDLNVKAFEINSRLKNRWLGGRIALDLSLMNGGRQYQEYARETAIRWPKSSFAAKVTRLDPDSKAAVAKAKRNHDEDIRALDC